MDLPCNVILGHGEADDVRVYVSVQSEYAQVDEAALAKAVAQFLQANVGYVTSTSAERHEVVYPITPIPLSGS